MMSQVIRGETYKDIKYHGKVKYFIFECNHCHAPFEKLESYFSKQLKKRKNACCFCTAACRARYISDHRPRLHTVTQSSQWKHAGGSGIFKSLLKAILAEP